MTVRRTADRRPVIVFCTERFWPACGGVEQYVLELARAFRYAAHVLVLTVVRTERGLPQTLAAGGRTCLRANDGLANIDVLTLRLEGPARYIYRGVAALERIAHSIARGRYYDTRWRAREVTARLLAWAGQAHTRGVLGEEVVLHAMGPWELGGTGDRLFSGAARVATPFIHPGYWGEDERSRQWYRSRDHVVALGERDALACHAAGVPMERITVVPTFRPREVEPTEPGGRRRSVLFLGVARYYKGADVFVEMVRLLRAELRNVDFVWAGAIPTEPSALALVDEARAAGVAVLGRVSEERKWRLLREAFCTCLPSGTEVAPYVVLESWAAGTPVVATDLPALREFVDDGGLLCSRSPGAFAAAVRQLLTNAHVRERLVSSGRRLLRTRHDITANARRLREAYEHALERRQERLGRPVGAVRS